MNIKSDCKKHNITQRQTTPDEFGIAPDQSELFDKINKYVIENISDMNIISVNNIASHFNISIGYISKLYRRKTSGTFISYVLELKLREAKRLLEEAPETKIKDIALKLGYTNTMSFIRLFKRKLGITPGEYRRKKNVK